MQPDGMQMSRFWLLAILSEHLITAEPENGLMYLKVYIFKAFYTNLINSHRCDLIRKLWPLHWSRYENVSVFKGLLLRTQLWCEKEIIYWFRKWIHLGTLTLKTFLWSCFSIFTRNCVLGSMFWNSGFIPKLYFQHEKETPSLHLTKWAESLGFRIPMWQGDVGKKGSLTVLVFRSGNGESQGLFLIFLFSSKLSEKSDFKLDWEQLLPRIITWRKEQHAKARFKLTGVHWTIADKI